MSNFPLYDNLIKDISTKDLSVKQKEEFISKVENIDNKGRDLIFALIQFYYIKNESEISFENIPYKGIYEKNENDLENITWSLSDLPVKLRNILYKFILIHMQSIEEEQARCDQVF